jgi:hypothetical protein
MKSNFLLAVFVLMNFSLFSQTLIGSSNAYDALAGNNQRKIVRDYNDNIFVVFADIQGDVNTIMGVKYSSESGEWEPASEIAEGQNPTLAIGPDDLIHLIYESNNTNHRIMYSFSNDFINWTTPVLLSDEGHHCHLPVADVDSAGIVNIFWIEEFSGTYENLVYCALTNDTTFVTHVIISKGEINDIAIANHLQYRNNDLFFAISFGLDSLQFFRSTDHLNTFDTVYSEIGFMPCITFNSDYNYWDDESLVRFLYLNPTDDLQEAEAWSVDYTNIETYPFPFGPTQFVCIDDLAPPIGYSFLFIQNGILKHGFSYGVMWYWVTIMNTFQYPNPIYYASIAYKQFNPLFADFIWMVSTGSYYNIYYQRDDKHEWLPGFQDNEEGKGFYVTGRPNPFSENINVYVTSEREDLIPSIQIYDIQSQLIRTLEVANADKGDYTYVWDGKNSAEIKVDEGIYLVLCSVGEKRIARKIMLKH